MGMILHSNSLAYILILQILQVHATETSSIIMLGLELPAGLFEVKSRGKVTTLGRMVNRRILFLYSEDEETR